MNLTLSRPVARIVDLYTKNGVDGAYMLLLTLSPDHGVGFIIAVDEPNVSASYTALVRAVSQVWLTAAEHAGRQQTEAVFSENYTLPKGGSVEEVRIGEGEPGLEVARLLSNGSDVITILASLQGVPLGT
ncbi:hypothetical protein N657DRAFT_651729 [Parathielavia appendiculata]|uniref:Uncharacterized protein n=1 Tax=Parathielavia appendiculata TaxID=2587402 RepID=A0AAN6TNZ9_9PEZI|nr:hypothetical protein N657DRAFT_651729 [Parathielavia appendiculata]